MTQYPSYARPGTQTQTIKPTSNGLGTAGLIVSIIGTLACGTLAPIGLILSLIGLRKEPRGLAIAGSVVGLLGTGILLFFGIGIVKTVLGVKAFVGNVATEMQSHEAAQKILAEKKLKGSLPSESVGNALIKGEKDAWEHPLRYKPSGTTFKIVSDGPDGKPDTGDDLSFSEEELRANLPTTEPSEMDKDSADPDASDTGLDEEPAAKPAPAVKPAPSRTTTPKTTSPRTTTPKAAPKPTKPPVKTSDDGL